MFKKGKSSGGPVHAIGTMEQFKKRVLNNKKPAIVDFYAPWCGPCKAMAPIFKKVASKEDSLFFAKVNTEASPAIANRFRVRSLPTVLTFWEGEVMDIQVGLVTEEKLRDMVERMKSYYNMANPDASAEEEEQTEAAKVEEQETPAKKSWLKRLFG